MGKELPIVKIENGEAILRAGNAEVSFPLSEEHKTLIEDMKVTVKAAKGVGLAAPQVGKNVMIAVINLEDLEIPPFAVINPRIISKSIKKNEAEEGCLSIPGKYLVVRRPARIEVEAYREDGTKLIINADRLFATVLQHEIDHLNGTLIIDRMK